MRCMSATARRKNKSNKKEALSVVAKGITGGHFMKYILSLLLITAMLLTLAACGGKTPYPGTTDPALSATANTQNDPQDALSALRADMKPPVIAVANFHFPELSDNFGIMDYLLDEYPNWMAENDFIRNMPDERVVITCGYEAWANLVCVVPYDPLSTVSVKAVRLAEEGSDGQENVVYRSESGEPILLLAEISDYVTVSVEVVDSEGRGVTWYPYWENAVPIPEDGYSGHLVMDFSPASEKSAYQNALDSGWTVPDDSFLTNHYWQSDYGYQLELYYKSMTAMPTFTKMTEPVTMYVLIRASGATQMECCI